MKNKEVKVINLTPHKVIVLNEERKVVKEFLPSGNVPRATTIDKCIGEIDGIPIYESKLGEVKDLPPKREGRLLIVSNVIKSLFPERKDLLVPHHLVRDDEGKIIGCMGFRN